MKTTGVLRNRTAAVLLSSTGALACGAASATEPDAQARQQAWRAAIEATPLPGEGCFTAAFPSAEWHPAACKAAPLRPYVPRDGHRGFTAGDGNDYTAVASSLVSSGTGSFPRVSGVKSETGYGGQANTYSIQLNSQFFTTAVCHPVILPGLAAIRLFDVQRRRLHAVLAAQLRVHMPGRRLDGL